MGVGLLCLWATVSRTGVAMGTSRDHWWRAHAVTGETIYLGVYSDREQTCFVYVI